MPTTQTTTADHITQTAAHLSLVEIVIGSFVHGLKLPFAGQVLSLNQGLFLCRALKYTENRRQGAAQSFEISGVASVLKSLSPAGNKIGPMLSIGMQGTLFSLGILIGGLGLVGQVFGMLMLSIWAFIQPFVSLFVIYGSDIEKVFFFYSERMTKEVPGLAHSLSAILLMAISVKFILAASIPFLLFFIGEEKIKSTEDKYLKTVAGFQRKTTARPMSPSRGALHDMTRPLFLLSSLLVISFFFFTESDSTKIFWLALRPLAIAFILFYLVRSPTFLGMLEKLAKKNQFLNRIYLQALQAHQYINQKFLNVRQES